MNKKPALFITLGVLVLGVIALLVFRAKTVKQPTVIEEPVVNLPVNMIPVSERPYVTLAPDSTGRTIELFFDQLETDETVEYELVYQAGTTQEGAFGRLNPGVEPLPITKDLLLGSKSGGGKVTYHEGVTGGSLTLTYGTTKLKEQFNFLHFDPTDPTVSSPDARFSVELTKTALTEDAVIITMKTFGLPMELEGNLVAGPYTYQSATAPKGEVVVSITLPAGEHVNPTIYEYDAKSADWTALKTTLSGDIVSAVASAGSTFVVTTE